MGSTRSKTARACPDRLPRRQHRRHAWQGRVRHPEEGHAAGGGQEEEVVARVCACVPPSYLLSEVMTVWAARRVAPVRSPACCVVSVTVKRIFVVICRNAKK